MNAETQALGIQNMLSMMSRDIAKVENRVSTGYKVTKASDNPADYVISQMMGRTISGLQTAKVNVGNASNLVSVAEGGLKGIKDLLGEMRATSLTAADATKSGAERAALKQTIAEQMKEIDDMVRQTTWGGKQLLNGAGLFAFQTGANPGNTTSVKIDQNFFAREIGVGDTGPAAQVAWTADSDGRNVYVGDYSAVQNAEWTLEFTSAGTFNVTSTTVSEPPTATGAIGSQYSDAGVQFQLAASGNSTDYAVGDRVTFSSSASVIDSVTANRAKGTTGNAAATASSSYTGEVDGTIQINITGSGNATVISSQSQLTGSFTFSGSDGSTQSGTLTVDSDGRATITAGSWDSGVTIQFSDNDQIGTTNDFLSGDSFSFDVEAAAVSAPDTTGVIGDSGISLDTAAAASTSISHIDKAIKTVETYETLLGSTSRRLEIRESSLSTMVMNNTAAMDRIVKADLMEEQLNLTKYTVQQQAALAMFMHANTQMQTALSVLRI
jgi:flagellin